MCIGGSPALLQQAIPYPAPARMAKKRLLDTCQSNLTTRPREYTPEAAASIRRAIAEMEPEPS